MINYIQIARQNRIDALRSLTPGSSRTHARPKPLFISRRGPKPGPMAIECPMPSLADMPTFYSC